MLVSLKSNKTQLRQHVLVGFLKSTCIYVHAFCSWMCC